MRNQTYHKHFMHPFFFFITSVFVLESFTTTTSLSWSRMQPPTSLGNHTSNSKCSNKERQALLHFKSFTRYDFFGLLTTWTFDEANDCCYWSGVTCNNHSRVTSLDLAGGFVGGEISPSLLNLSYLNYLDLSDNSFLGTIPEFIGSMTQLRYLYLGWNDFTGIIPVELGNLTNLQELLLEDLISCTIENLDWLSRLSHLDNLVMSGTSLARVDNWVNVILSLKRLSALGLDGCDLSRVLQPYSYSYVNSSFSSSIVALSLTENNLDSSMYHWLSLLTSNALEELDVSGNKLDGIPGYLGNLCSLTSLFISGNSMPINLHDFLSNLSGCTSVTSQYLEATYSQFQGSLSDHIQNFSSLKVLQLSNNQLNGTMSEKVWQLPKLRTLDVSSNFLKGSISENIVESNILNVNLSNNSLEGAPLDAPMSNISNVEQLDLNLSSNNFYGRIPNAPSSLEILDLSKNKLSGEIFFLCQIVDGSLSSLDLSHNLFTGQIPDCLWHFKELKVLSLGYNNLSGRLPASTKLLINLEVLYLYNNSFSGKLPFYLKNLTKLTFLNLGANEFSGYVPGWIGERLSRFYALVLTSNKFIGTIPSQLCQLAYLQILDLSMNKLHGAIPSCLNNITSMVQDGFAVNQNVHYFNFSGGEYVDHCMIKWQGSLREFGSTLDLVKIINLSSNNLTGKIPDELNDLHNLVALDLSMNALVGEIPPNIGMMKQLLILDLSRNNLSGRIPSSMSHMTLLNYLNVSYNNLSGRIPSGTQLQSFAPSSYTGNGELCGLPVSKYCPGDKELEVPPVTGESVDDGEDRDDLRIWVYIGAVTGFAIGFWIVCIALLVKPSGRRAFFHLMDSLENWVYVKVMVLIAKLLRIAHP
ncbi:receptor-like protein EIX2 [Bidens hawaiensis]|uniref:receptor-like protein EIX2 n=1 Tax=Bidens hawaiensis TaxID=980011 RepID=UPI0040497B49